VVIVVDTEEAGMTGEETTLSMPRLIINETTEEGTLDAAVGRINLSNKIIPTAIPLRVIKTHRHILTMEDMVVTHGREDTADMILRPVGATIHHQIEDHTTLTETRGMLSLPTSNSSSSSLMVVMPVTTAMEAMHLAMVMPVMVVTAAIIVVT